MDGPSRLSRRRTLVRYLAWQLPGWILVGLGVHWLHALSGLPTWAAWILVAGWIAKDLALFPVMRTAFEPARWGSLVSERGEAVEPLAPNGYVRVPGELWRAEARSGRIIARGSRVVVREVRGLSLLVDEDRAEV